MAPKGIEPFWSENGYTVDFRTVPTFATAHICSALLEILAVMPTLPLLAGDLHFFASSPALRLWYINLPLFTSTINIEHLQCSKK